jgi:hypothetical protein
MTVTKLTIVCPPLLDPSGKLVGRFSVKFQFCCSVFSLIVIWYSVMQKSCRSHAEVMQLNIKQTQAEGDWGGGGDNDNPIPTRFLAPIDCSKIPVEATYAGGIDYWSP